MRHLCKKIIVQFCIRRVHSFLRSCCRNLNWHQLILACCYLFTCFVMFAAGIVLFRAGHNLHKSLVYNQLIFSLAEQFPRVTEVDCRVFMGAAGVWNKSLQQLSQMDNITEELFDYTDCSKLRGRGFNIPTTDEEKKFPVAFSIIIYTDLQRFTRLLRAVYRSSNIYCIHVDRKSSREFKVTWQMIINLTGEEFPLRTNLELVNILQIMAGQNDVWLDPCTKDGPGNWTSNECTFLSETGFAERWENLSSAPHGVHPYKGQVHVVLSRAAVDYILHTHVARDVYDWISKAFIPDELYFSTMNSNPHLGVPGSNPNPRIWKRSIARLKLWKGRDRSVWPYCSFYQRFVCLFTARDLPLLTTSKQLVANKFKSSYRPIGYSCLEQWYFERVLLELRTGKLQLDMTEYRKLFPGDSH